MMAVERVEVERRAVDAADRRRAALVPRGSRRTGDGLREAHAVAVRSADVADRAESLRELLARGRKLVEQGIGTQRRQVRVRARVRPDLVPELEQARGAVPVERLNGQRQVQLVVREGPRLVGVRVEQVGDEEEACAEPLLGEQRRGVVELVAEAVVERDDTSSPEAWPRRSRSTACDSDTGLNSRARKRSCSAKRSRSSSKT